MCTHPSALFDWTDSCLTSPAAGSFSSKQQENCCSKIHKILRKIFQIVPGWWTETGQQIAVSPWELWHFKGSNNKLLTKFIKFSKHFKTTIVKQTAFINVHCLKILALIHTHIHRLMEAVSYTAWHCPTLREQTEVKNLAQRNNEMWT